MNNIKWLLLCTIGIMSLPSLMLAQEGGQQIKFGAHFGLGSAGLQGSAVPDQVTEGKAGLAFGVEASIPFAESPFAVLPALSFIQKGVKVDAGKSDYDINLDYLQVPVLAELSFGEGLVFFSQMGPYIGFMQQARREGQVVEGTNPFTGETTTSNTDKSISSGVKDVDVGLKGGFGIRYPFFNGQVGFRILYSQGLTSLNKPGATAIFESQKLRGDVFNRVVNFRLHYRIALTDI